MIINENKIIKEEKKDPINDDDGIKMLSNK